MKHAVNVHVTATIALASLLLQNRAELTVNAISAVRAASVKHVVVLSTTVADIVTTLFGSQTHAIERAVKSCGVPFTILRLPFFFENNWLVFCSYSLSHTHTHLHIHPRTHTHTPTHMHVHMHIHTH